MPASDAFYDGNIFPVPQ